MRRGNGPRRRVGPQASRATVVRRAARGRRRRNNARAWQQTCRTPPVPVTTVAVAGRQDRFRFWCTCRLARAAPCPPPCPTRSVPRRGTCMGPADRGSPFRPSCTGCHARGGQDADVHDIALAIVVLADGFPPAYSGCPPRPRLAAPLRLGRAPCSVTARICTGAANEGGPQRRQEAVRLRPVRNCGGGAPSVARRLPLLPGGETDGLGHRRPGPGVQVQAARAP